MAASSGEPFDLERFVTAQAPVMEAVVAELSAGCKQGHWMWFVFPQLAGLGTSPMAQRYAISGLDEARAYLAHPILGDRLRGCTRRVLEGQGRTAEAIFGPIDAMKFRSSMTSFALADPEEPLFKEALERFYGGRQDEVTLARLGQAWG